MEEKVYSNPDLLAFVGKRIAIEHEKLAELIDWVPNDKYGEFAGEGWFDIDLRPFTDYLEYNDAWFAAHNSWFAPSDEQEDDTEKCESPDGFLLKVVLWFRVSPAGIITSIDLSACGYATYGDDVEECELDEDPTADDYAYAVKFLSSIVDKKSPSIFDDDDQRRYSYNFSYSVTSEDGAVSEEIDWPYEVSLEDYVILYEAAIEGRSIDEVLGLSVLIKELTKEIEQYEMFDMTCIGVWNDFVKKHGTENVFDVYKLNLYL